MKGFASIVDPLESQLVCDVLSVLRAHGDFFLW